MDVLEGIKQNSAGRFHYFLPCRAGGSYRNRNFAVVAAYQTLPPGPTRHRARTANTSAVCCTKARWHVECTFSREYALQITGTRKEVPQQYLGPCRIPGFESQPQLYVWLMVADSLSRNYSTPFHLSYATSAFDTHWQHGDDLRNRIEMENCLSEFSQIIFSRDIFQKPRIRQLHPHGLVSQVDILNSNQTNFPQFAESDLTSVTLGSFQNKHTHSYITKMRQVQKSNFTPRNLKLN